MNYCTEKFVSTLASVFSTESKIKRQSDSFLGPLYISHPTDPAKYYFVDELGVWHEFTCPSGLLFDPEIHACNWPENIGGGSSDTGGGGEYGGGVNRYLPHPTDPTRYYVIDIFDVWYELQCPSGLMFNPVLQICDWSQNVSSNGLTVMERVIEANVAGAVKGAIVGSTRDGVAAGAIAGSVSCSTIAYMEEIIKTLF